jgi:hypothetical protein
MPELRREGSFHFTPNIGVPGVTLCIEKKQNCPGKQRGNEREEWLFQPTGAEKREKPS